MKKNKKNKPNPFMDRFEDIVRRVVREEGPDLLGKSAIEKLKKELFTDFKKEVFAEVEEKMDSMVEVRVAATLHDLLGDGGSGGATASKEKLTRKKRPRCTQHECAKNKDKGTGEYFCRKCREAGEGPLAGGE